MVSGYWRRLNEIWFKNNFKLFITNQNALRSQLLKVHGCQLGLFRTLGVSDGRRLLPDEPDRGLVGRGCPHLLRQRLRRLRGRPEDAQRLQEAQRPTW